MRFAKIYLEITNVCNLSCSFCPGTVRPSKFLSTDEFIFLLPKLRPYAEYLYFHLMGEPLLHPELSRFLKIADDNGFRVILTSNGTLLKKRKAELLEAASLHKINLSLHSFEANERGADFDEYLSACLELGRIPAPERNFIVAYRLWNGGGADRLNGRIESAMHEAFPGDWDAVRGGFRLADRVFLQYGEKFDWPGYSPEESNENTFCYALRDQIGVLSDGTVVPCCLDRNGDLALGNLFSQSMEEILNSERARSIYEGFSRRTAAEELCRQCGFVKRFQKG